MGGELPKLRCRVPNEINSFVYTIQSRDRLSKSEVLKDLVNVAINDKYYDDNTLSNLIVNRFSGAERETRYSLNVDPGFYNEETKEYRLKHKLQNAEDFLFLLYVME